MIAGHHEDTQLPLRGVVLCCTSIDPEMRTQLTAWAAEMGADHKLDLTSDVTHLIVGETQTPKYRYVAKEREDVKCLTEGWIPAVRKIWMQGADVPLKALEEEHKLPTFYLLRICITGFEDPDQRKELEIQIARHGGEYRGDLRKDCTHLVCCSPSGAKYTSAKAWGNIRTVSIEWLSMSIERGLVLDEELFDPLLAPEERGRNAWKKTGPKSPVLKRTRADDVKTLPTRKLRRTASSKFSSDSMWQDMVLNRPSEEGVDQSGLRRTHSEPLNKVMAPPLLPMHGEIGSKAAALHATYNTGAITKPSTRRGVFSGRRFWLHGFDQRRVQLLRQHLESQDGEVSDEVHSLSPQSVSHEAHTNFIVVPYSSSPKDSPSMPSPPHDCIVTELWVEKCLHKKIFIQPGSEPAHSPFRHPLAGFDKLTISSTGFEGVDLMHVGKVLTLLGSSYTEAFTKHTSLLLCFDDSVTRQKFKHALGWSVPAVKASWLWDCVRSGYLKPWQDYLVRSELQKSLPRISRGLPSLKEQAPDGLGNKQLLGRSMPDNSKALPTPDSGAIATGMTLTESIQSGYVAVKSASDTFPAVGNNIPRSDRQRPQPLIEVPTNRRQAVKPLRDGQLTFEKGDDLVDSLHALIAKTKEQKSQRSAGSPDPSPRKKRQIFGRARSDLSTRSNLSRAGSIDSMNTDGMGTPIEFASHTSPRKLKAKPSLLVDETAPLSAEILLSHDETYRHSASEEEEPSFAATQIGYDNSEATMWRDILSKKMCAGKGREQVETSESTTQARKPVLTDTTTTISKRTRLNTK